MTRLKSVLGYAWAALMLPIILFMFFNFQTLPKALVDGTGLKINPWYSGGEVVRTVPHPETVLDTHIHRPVFDALVGQFSEGFVQVDWRSRTGFMPAVVTEDITFGPGPGPDFRIAFDSRTLEIREFKAFSPAVLGVEGVYPLHRGVAARIRLRRTP